jgi:hypothetical protein
MMTEEEQIKRFGQSYPERLYVIVKVKDPKTGAEAPGYGWWPKSVKAYGEDKGNTQFNMAMNRAERQALSRLRPGEMPTNIEVMDEQVIEASADKGFDVESTAREVPSEETTVSGEETTTLEDSLEPAVVSETPVPTQQQEQPKDETPAKKTDIAKILALRDKAGMTMADLGAMINKELKWKISGLSDLKAWQAAKLIDVLSKATGK